MTVATYTGDPDSVCAYIQGIIGSGETIDIVTLTKNNSEYIIISSAASSPKILQEDGFALLQEDGFNILLE